MRIVLTAAAVVLGMASVANAAFMNVVMQDDFSSSAMPTGLTAVNSPTVSNGAAVLNGLNDNGAASGFAFDVSSYVDSSGPTTSWCMEAVVKDTSEPDQIDTLFSFDGGYGARYRTDYLAWSIYSDGHNTAAMNSLSNGDHVGLVYTAGAVGGTLAVYQEGTLVTSFEDAEGYYYTSQAGFGLEVHSGAPLSRGFNGSLNAIAFSTFTGTFHPTADFALRAVPEPATCVLLSIGVLGLIAYAWRRRN